MNFNRRLACVAIATLGITLMIGNASAALIAYDSAGDSAYNSGTVIGVNGGYGWGGPWSANLGLYLQSSTLLGGAGSGTGYINSPQTPDGRAWAVGSDSGYDPIKIQTKTASRPFSGALMPGQTFSIEFDDSPGAVAGILLGDLAVAIGGTNNYIFEYEVQSTVGPTYDFGPAVTDFGARADFTVLTDSTAQVTVTSLAPGGESDSFILPYSTPMTGMLAENFPWGSANGFLYINNMSITPEPNGIALAIAALAVISLGRRGRARRAH